MGTQHSPQFSVRVYCGQMAGCIQMPLGTEVGLGPGHIALDGDPAHPPPKKRQSPKILGPCLLWQNGWMDEDDTSYGGRPRLRPHCVKWGSSSILQGAQPPPDFWPMSVVPNGWMDQDATLYGGRPRPRPYCVRSGPATPPKRVRQFSAHVYCDQTVAHFSYC